LPSGDTQIPRATVDPFGKGMLSDWLMATSITVTTEAIVSTSVFAEVFCGRLGQNTAQPIGFVGDASAKFANQGNGLSLRADAVHERAEDQREEHPGNQ
jgi:hypothetical protein